MANPVNDFLPFANAGNANVLSQADYLALANVRASGFLSGTARSPQLNKVWRQSSAIASMIAAFTVASTQRDLLDNGNQQTLQDSFTNALVNQPYLRSQQRTPDSVNYIGAYSPGIPSLVDGMILFLYTTNTNNGAATFTPNTLLIGPLPILRLTGAPLSPRDIIAGRWITLQYNATVGAWFLQNTTPSSSIAAGTVAQFAMLNMPSGWLACDGSAILRATYPDLFNAIGTTWGAGNGTTTFNLPDLRGYYTRGFGTNGDGTASGAFAQRVAADVLRHGHTIQINDPGHGHAASQPAHNHGINDPGHEHPYGFEIAGLGVNTSGLPNTPWVHPTGRVTTGISLDAAQPAVNITGNSTGITASAAQTGGENRPVTIALPFGIKT